MEFETKEEFESYLQSSGQAGEERKVNSFNWKLGVFDSILAELTPMLVVPVGLFLLLVVLLVQLPAARNGLWNVITWIFQSALTSF